jgi:hypothetical protein
MEVQVNYNATQRNVNVVGNDSGVRLQNLKSTTKNSNCHTGSKVSEREKMQNKRIPIVAPAVRY